MCFRPLFPSKLKSPPFTPSIVETLFPPRYTTTHPDERLPRHPRPASLSSYTPRPRSSSAATIVTISQPDTRVTASLPRIGQDNNRPLLRSTTAPVCQAHDTGSHQCPRGHHRHRQETCLLRHSATTPVYTHSKIAQVHTQRQDCARSEEQDTAPSGQRAPSQTRTGPRQVVALRMCGKCETKIHELLAGTG